MSLGLLNENSQLSVKYNKANIYQAQRKKLLRETERVMRLVEVLTYVSIFKIWEGFDGGRGGLLCQIYIL